MIEAPAHFCWQEPMAVAAHRAWLHAALAQRVVSSEAFAELRRQRAAQRRRVAATMAGAIEVAAAQ